MSWFRTKRKAIDTKSKPKPHHSSPMQRQFWEEVKEQNKSKEVNECTNTKQK